MNVNKSVSFVSKSFVSKSFLNILNLAPIINIYIFIIGGGNPPSKIHFDTNDFDTNDTLCLWWWESVCVCSKKSNG